MPLGKEPAASKLLLLIFIFPLLLVFVLYLKDRIEKITMSLVIQHFLSSFACSSQDCQSVYYSSITLSTGYIITPVGIDK